MASNIEVPSLGESVTEAVLAQWLKNDGDQVSVDEPLCELESDKATVALPAPASGVLYRGKDAGETAKVGEVIGRIEESSKIPAQPTPSTLQGPAAQKPVAFASKPEPAERDYQPRAYEPAEKKEESPAPAIQPSTLEEATARGKVAPRETAPRPERQAVAVKTESVRPVPPSSAPGADGEEVRRVPMSKLRRRIAERLVRAKQTTAMLTTFNEVDMSTVQDLRARHKERFMAAHGVGLGLMSFFARATVLALKELPGLNAEIDGDDILYHDYVHLGVAVSTERGLVVPVLRNAEQMSFPRIESEIKRTATAARSGKLAIEELSGGTFTITNGGVFGSLLSTPILNPPQTGILGMHTIQERPVARDGQVVIRPMMYVALSYDHRLVDGREAVTFLTRLKQMIEDPMEMILGI
jgi:2-oxoglutarate dehydrogenase E2 component (dihydrolipoamide succinyltransferase)